MKVSFSALFIVLCLFFTSVKTYSSCFPDTMYIKPVIINGTKIQHQGAGAITSVVDSIAMIKSFTANLSDLVLQNTPVFIKEYGRGAMATASFRGTAPSHTQVLWNGINLNSPMMGMVDFSTIPVYFTDQVSLLHGSGSLSENSGALGGIVKLQNNPDFNNSFSGRILTGIGSYGTRDEMIRLNLGNRKIQFQTRSFFNQSDNDFSFINKLNADIDPRTGKYIYPTQRNENAAYQNYGNLEELYYKASEKSLFSIRYWYQHNERSLPRLLTNESDDTANINKQRENAHRATAEWKKYGNQWTLNISTGLNVQFLDYWLKTRISGSDDQFAVNSTSRSGSLYNKVYYDYRFKDDLTVSAGLDVNIHEVKSTNTSYNEEPYGYLRSRNEDAFYLSLNKNFGEKFSTTLIGRQNFINGHSTPFIPSAGLDFHPFHGFYIKSNLAKNFHQPSLNDLYYIPGGNPNLKPEEGIMADLGAGYKTQIGSSVIQSSVNGYYSRISNWIIWLPNPQGYWVPFNMKTVDASGIEMNLNLNGKFGNYKYRFLGNYAFTRSLNKDNPQNWADDSYGKQLPYIPLHSANISGNISQNGYFLTWMWTYYSQRYTTSSTDKDSKMDVIYPYIMNNISVGKGINLSKGSLNIELKILNLFNEDYRTVLQNPMPGRNYSLLLRYDF